MSKKCDGLLFFMRCGMESSVEPGNSTAIQRGQCPHPLYQRLCCSVNTGSCKLLILHSHVPQAVVNKAFLFA